MIAWMRMGMEDGDGDGDGDWRWRWYPVKAACVHGFSELALQRQAAGNSELHVRMRYAYIQSHAVAQDSEGE